MEAFSDGVIAILVTIMVLQLRQPHGTSFADLRSSFPSLLAYLLSFVNIAIYWLNHHHLVKTVKRVTGGMLWANLNLLFCISLFPFATAWMAENGFATNPVATYGVVCVLSAIAYTVLQTVIVATWGEESALRAALGRDAKAKLSLLAYVLSIPLAFAWRWVSVAIFVGVALVWFIPDRRIQNLVESTDTGATG